MSPLQFTAWTKAHGLNESNTEWQETKFKEFWEIFPRKTRTGRVLRPLSPTAKKAAMAYALFKREIKTEEEANKAIRGLKRELQARMTQPGGIEYMNNIETYIRNKNFELYYSEEDDIEEQEDIDLEEGSNFNVL